MKCLFVIVPEHLQKGASRDKGGKMYGVPGRKALNPFRSPFRLLYHYIR